MYYYPRKENGEHLITYTRHAKENYKTVWKDFNLNKINPSDYEKIEFIGNPNDFDTRASWSTWGPYIGKKINQVVNGKETYDVMKNIHSDNNFDINNTFNLQSLDIPDFLAKLRVEQNLGLTWYREKRDYHLQLLIRQYVETWASEVGGGVYMCFGQGIRLYNDDESIRKKSEVFDINKLEKNDLKNITKWTDEFRKSINNEQHLPIDNKTNFVTNNITSL